LVCSTHGYGKYIQNFTGKIEKKKDSLGDLGVERRMMLKGNLKKRGIRVLTGCNWIWMDQMTGACEHGTEYSGSIKIVKSASQEGYCSMELALIVLFLRK
jgi:hypothetical protein